MKQVEKIGDLFGKEFNPLTAENEILNFYAESS